ncbi:MAG: hypothetical protein HQL53_05845 [Magnetococcales bacterium]|nr:hypothetical protein [Magnetococcales bacterium]
MATIFLLVFMAMFAMAISGKEQKAMSITLILVDTTIVMVAIFSIGAAFLGKYYMLPPS